MSGSLTEDSATAALHDLLCDLFDDNAETAHKFVRQISGSLVRYLPSPKVDASTYIQKWIELLEQHGHIDRDLFGRLLHAFPDRVVELSNIARRLSIEPAPVPPVRRHRLSLLLPLIFTAPVLALLPLAFQTPPEPLSLSPTEALTHSVPTFTLRPDLRPPPDLPSEPGQPALSHPTSTRSLVTALRRAGATDRQLADCWSMLDHSDWNIAQFKFNFTRDEATRAIVVTAAFEATRGQVSSCFERQFARRLKQRGITRLAADLTLPLSALRP